MLMTNRFTMLLATLTFLAPVMLGSSHIEGETYLPFLFAVFAVVWVVFFVYLYFISRKQAELKREIEALRYQAKDIADS